MSLIDTGWLGVQRFGAGGAVIPVVMQFTGPAILNGAGPHVNAGQFWNTTPASTDADIGSFRYDMLVRADRADLLQYVLSDGSGGAHAALCGLSPGSGAHAGTITLEGDFYKGPVNPAFDYTSQACDEIMPGQWFLYTVTGELSGESGKMFYAYVDGVCVLAKPWGVGSRFSGNAGMAMGTLFWAGSDHLNFAGKLAYGTLWDANKRAIPAGQSIFTLGQAFRPSVSPTIVQGGEAADHVADFTKPATIVPDFAVGQIPQLTGANARGAALHPGILEFALPAPGREGFPRPLPTWMLDTACPLYLSLPRVIANAKMSAPQSIPPGCLIFDDFSVRDSEFMWTDYPKLGSTVGGSRGALVWQARADTVNTEFPYGVKFGFAYYSGVGDAPAFPAHVNANTANMDVQIEIPIDCDPGRTAGLFVGPAVVFRLSDDDNFWVAFAQNAGDLQLRKYTAGVAADVGPVVSLIPGYTHIRATAIGTTITLYSGTRSGLNIVWTQLEQLTNVFNSNATQAGIAFKGGSQGRIKNITVFAA